MPIDPGDNPFKPTGAGENYDELVGRLWQAFAGGLNGFQIDEGVVERTRFLFEMTSRDSYDKGRFDESGVEARACACCRATGAISRALAEMNGNTYVNTGDYESAARFVKRLTGEHGAVC